jgi:hypothetical protein
MRSLTLACVLLCSVVSTAQSLRPVKQVDDSHFELDFHRHGEVRLHIQPSALQISGSDEDKIKIHFWSDRDDTRDVKVRLESSGNTADVDVSEGPHHDFHVEIQVPRRSALYLRIMAGKVDIDNVTGNKNIELSAGDLTVQVGDAGEYSEVDASVYTGELNASPFGVSKGGLFRSFHKTGPGEYRLYAHVGAGQIRLVP